MDFIAQQPTKKRKLVHCSFEYAMGPVQAEPFCKAYCNVNQTALPSDMTSVVSFQTGELKDQSDDDFSAVSELQMLECAELSFSVEEPQVSSKIMELPEDVLAQIGCFLNVGSLKVARLACRKFHRVFSKDEAGWSAHCQRLWSKKVHVSKCAMAMLEDAQTSCSSEDSSCALEAYRNSCMDSRLRHAVDPEELIYDPKSGRTTVWDFRFKETSGMEWTAHDPWHAGHSARRMVFLPDGTVRQLVEEVVVDVDSPCKAETVQKLRLPFHDASDPVGVEIKWRFVRQPMDFPLKSEGAYIRLTVGGRDVPTYVVHRSPTGNWGFVMENCWGVFASFRLPSKTLRSEQAYVSNRELLDDSKLSVSNEWQWREALLYNLGSPTLPDGPAAVAQFERAWQVVVRRLQASGYTPEQISRRLRI